MAHTGGRGRGRSLASGQLKGATWDHDDMLKLESRPSLLFPQHPGFRTPQSPSQRERKQISYYKDLREQIHRGPLYTQPTRRDTTAPAKTFNEDQFNLQFATDARADMDPFADGVETYSKRYAPSKNVLPRLSDQAFVKAFYPKELWSTIDGRGTAGGRAQFIRNDHKMNGKADTSSKERRLLDKISKVAGDREEDLEENDDPRDEIEEDKVYEDEDFGEDDNAEQYFDGGEGLSDDDDGGRGGDDY